MLAGKTRDDLNPSDRSAYIHSGNYLPYWSDDSGFVELLTSNGDTADFVRFGGETENPLTQGYWSGTNVAAFLSANAYSVSGSPDPLDRYDRSIVRLSANFTVTGTKADWTQVAFPTPGGPNDVAAGVTDSDEDGIPDSAKVAGGTFAGLDLHGMGARPGHRDLFIHVDYMNYAYGQPVDPGIRPRKEALQKVADAFQPQIYVHFDAGNLFSPGRNPAEFNLSGNISHGRYYALCMDLVLFGGPPHPGCTSLHEFSTTVDVRRRPIFRYLLMASSRESGGVQGSSGVAELPGNKFEVTLGKWDLSDRPGNDLNKLINYQAGTITHELGHTLNLKHGGFEDRNEKPNYFSVMNYLYQLSGLPSDPAGLGPTQRYYYQRNRVHGEKVPGPAINPNSPLPKFAYRDCDQPDGPCGSGFKIDYSDGSGDHLSERSLCENRNIGRNCNRKIDRDCKRPIDAKCGQDEFGDWNLNATADTQRYAGQLAERTSDPQSLLMDFNDWGEIVLRSGRNYYPPNLAMALRFNAQARLFNEQAPTFDERAQLFDERVRLLNKQAQPAIDSGVEVLLRDAPDGRNEATIERLDVTEQGTLRFDAGGRSVTVAPWPVTLHRDDPQIVSVISVHHPAGAIEAIELRAASDDTPWFTLVSSGRLDWELTPGFRLERNGADSVAIRGSGGFRKVASIGEPSVEFREGDRCWQFVLLNLSLPAVTPGAAQEKEPRAGWYLRGDRQC